MGQKLFFAFVKNQDIIKEIHRLNPRKAAQGTYIPVTILMMIKTFLRDISMFSLMKQLHDPNFFRLFRL